MRLPLLQTPQGQASIALVGVLLIACTAAFNGYLFAKEQARGRAALALVERQIALADALTADDRGTDSLLRQGHIAAGDYAMALLAHLGHSDHSDLAARIGAVRQAWMHLRPGLAAIASGYHQAGRGDLRRDLEALALLLRQDLGARVRVEAMHQVLILSGAAPLLAWAFFAISLAPAPYAAEEGLDAPGAPSHAQQVRARFNWREAACAQGQAPLPQVAPYTAQILRSAPTPAELDVARELRSYATDFRQISGLTVELFLDEWAAALLAPSSRPQALTIAREAITAASRHDGVSQIRVTLWPEPGEVWLAVADNGASATGHALAITRVRAERIGGELQLLPNSEGGTLVMVRLPVGAPVEHRGAQGLVSEPQTIVAH